MEFKIPVIISYGNGELKIIITHEGIIKSLPQYICSPKEEIAKISEVLDHYLFSLLLSLGLTNIDAKNEDHYVIFTGKKEIAVEPITLDVYFVITISDTVKQVPAEEFYSFFMEQVKTPRPMNIKTIEPGNPEVIKFLQLLSPSEISYFCDVCMKQIVKERTIKSCERCKMELDVCETCITNSRLGGYYCDKCTKYIRFRLLITIRYDSDAEEFTTKVLSEEEVKRVMGNKECGDCISGIEYLVHDKKVSALIFSAQNPSEIVWFEANLKRGEEYQMQYLSSIVQYICKKERTLFCIEEPILPTRI
jgi:hypothetical protein